RSYGDWSSDVCSSDLRERTGEAPVPQEVSFAAMGLLAPLYIAGLLAIALPVLFHLMRRTPRGRQEFSSLMFLAASPPRVTRRSQIGRDTSELQSPYDL